MSSQSLKRKIKLNAWVAALIVFTLVSCKKEVVQVTVDAYAKIDARVEHHKGIYSLEFSLQEYPYKEVGIRLSSVKSKFQQAEGLNTQVAVEIAANRYSVFYDTLVGETTYYYQIYVVDPATAKTIYSDVYSFTTNK